MIIFALFGMLVTASIAGLLWYKVTNDEEEEDDQLSLLPDDWEEYKQLYEAPDEYNIHPEA